MNSWLMKLKSLMFTRRIRDRGRREQVGAFIITARKNLHPDGIGCAMCGKLLSRYDASSDTHAPPCEQLLAEGKVPIPNFGWFCSHGCADAYEGRYGVHFQRTAEGKVDYYSE
ncbi:MAG TPA: hypothetical protein VGB76_09705 [Pyrinomonadaceae bacterium]|jgi:hypothetical protein